MLEQSLRSDTSDISEYTIASRFERQVAAVPDKLAIVTDEISLTYRALDLKAGRIAAGLASLPSQRELPIMLFMKDEAARIAAMLGTWKANRIFLPLAANSPANWVAHVIENSGTAQIIVDSSTRSIAELAATGRVTVMEIEQSLDHCSLGWPTEASSDDTAYIVYTSGSTGRPKGVANSHRRLIRWCDLRYPLFGPGRSDRYANLRSSGVSAWVTYQLVAVTFGGMPVSV